MHPQIKSINKISKIISLICLILFFGCNKEDELSDVTLNIKLIDENDYPVENGSNIIVTLTRGQENYSETTTSNGNCTFESLPHGVFNVELKKDGFISEYIAPKLSYYEIDSIDVHQFKMLEIPQYTVSIDSITRSYEMDYETRLYGYGTLHNIKGIPKIQYRLIAYFSDNEDVSKNNYTFYHYTTILGWKIANNSCELMITNWVNSFIVPPEADTLYVRFYPCARYPDWGPIREEAFGSPSDAFKWIVPEY